MGQAVVFNPRASYATVEVFNAVETMASKNNIQGHILSCSIALVAGTVALVIDAAMHLGLGIAKLSYCLATDNKLDGKKTTLDPSESSIWNSDQGLRHIRKSICYTGAAVANLGLWIQPKKSVKFYRQWGLMGDSMRKLSFMRAVLRKTANVVQGLIRMGLAPVVGVTVFFAPLIMGVTISAFLLYRQAGPNGDLPYFPNPLSAVPVILGVGAQSIWLFTGSIFSVKACWSVFRRGVSDLVKGIIH